MRKLLISENEKKRILNLHNKKTKRFSLNEDTGCPCPDGSMSDECCKQTQSPTTQTPLMSDEDKQKIDPQMKILKRQGEDIINLAIEEDKKKKIEEIQKKIDKLYDDMSNKKSNMYQKELFDRRIKELQNEKNYLSGLPTSQSGGPEKTVDQKIMSWVAVVSSILGVFTTLTQQFKKPQGE